MDKNSSTIMAVAALGTAVAAAMAIGSMKPNAKQQLKQDFKTAARDMNDVREQMCDVREDMTHMAKNLKNNMM